jgi:CRP-like cAMP-binding protein
MELLAQIRSWLASTPFFGVLDAGGMARLTAAARRRQLDRGETLWRQGEEPDALAVVVNGSLHVTRTSERGDILLLRILRPFDVVGLSTVAGAAHSADLVAGEPSAVQMQAQTLIAHEPRSSFNEDARRRADGASSASF